VKRDRLAPVLAIVGGAIVLVVALVIASQIGSGSKKSSIGTIATDSVAEMLGGIKQNGIYLGDPKAKLTLVEFADPQCPGCAEFAQTVFPSLVQKYVRSGKLRIEYQGQHFIDDFIRNSPKDSERMLRLAQAAGFQNKLWYVVELEYDNQPQNAENSGYATDSYLRGVASAVNGLNVDKAVAVANTNAVVSNMDAAKALADKSFKQLSTPSFLLGPTGAKPTEKFGNESLSAFSAAIDAQLKK
jgi:protein-disulfide isomerase